MQWKGCPVKDMRVKSPVTAHKTQTQTRASIFMQFHSLSLHSVPFFQSPVILDGGEGWNPPDPLRGHSFTDMTETEASHLVRLRKSAFTKINLCCLGDRAVLLRVIKNDLMRASKQAAVVMKARKTSFQSAFLLFFTALYHGGVGRGRASEDTSHRGHLQGF